MVNLAKTLAIIIFLVVVVIQLFAFNYISLFTPAMTQLNNFFNTNSGPLFKYYIFHDKIIIYIENNENFTIIVYNISGNYLYLPKQEVIPPNSAKNITLIITNPDKFQEAIKSSSYTLTIKLSFLDANVTVTQVI